MYHTVWQLKGERYVRSWPHPPPSLHGTWESNYEPLQFVTRPIYSQQQEIVKQSLKSSIAFQEHHQRKVAICENDPEQEESSVSIAPLSTTGPLRSLAPLLQEESITSTWSKTAQLCLLLSDRRISSMQSWAFHQPCSLPCQQRISGLKHQAILKAVITTHKRALKIRTTK